MTSVFNGYALMEIAKQVTKIDVEVMRMHRELTPHRKGQICDSCPQPITNLIARYAYDEVGIKPQRNVLPYYKNR